MRQPDNTTQPIEPAQQEAKLTRIVRKINKVNPFSYAPGVGVWAGKAIISDVEEMKSAIKNVEIGGMEMALGALLLGVPVGAAYGVLKMPEWIHTGIEKLKKMGVNISKEVEDIAWLKSLEGYVTGKQWAHKNIWRIKEKRA